jgi:hypothetical protein
VRAALHRSPHGLLAAALGGVLGAMGCGSPANTLTGSLGEVVPYDFDSVSLKADDSTFVVEYDRGVPADADGGAGGDVIFKMAVNIDGLKLNKDLVVDLAMPAADGSPRVACTRSVGTDPRRKLPPLQRGTLTLHSDINFNLTGTGELHILFGEGGDVGEGRTVDATFSANVQNANSGAQP